MMNSAVFDLCVSDSCACAAFPSTSSVITISESIPVPIAAISPANAARSIGRWVIAKNPSIITISLIPVRKIGITSIGLRYLATITAATVIAASIIIK